MTNRVPKSINTNDKLFKKFVKIVISKDVQYNTLKAKFINFKKTLSRCFNAVKQ